MRFILKQKLFAWGNDFHILNEQGKEVYFVDGTGIALVNRLTMKDSSQSEVAFIQQIVFSWGREYEIFRDGVLQARVSQKKLSRAKIVFGVDVPGPDDPQAEGDFYNHEYEFLLGKKVIARVSKQGLDEGYGVEILTEADPAVVLASVVVIDVITHEGSQHGSLYQ